MENQIKIMCFSLPLTEKQWTDNQLFNYFKVNEEMKNSIKYWQVFY